MCTDFSNSTLGRFNGLPTEFTLVLRAGGFFALVGFEIARGMGSGARLPVEKKFKRVHPFACIIF